MCLLDSQCCSNVVFVIPFQCTIAIGVHPPPRTCSSLKNPFSAPNHRTDMKLFVYNPNINKNEWNFFQFFFIIKNWQKMYKK